MPARCLCTDLHPSGVRESRPSTMPAMTWPPVMNTQFVVTSRPREAAGADSAMYMGMLMEEKPMARPTVSRPISST